MSPLLHLCEHPRLDQRAPREHDAGNAGALFVVVVVLEIDDVAVPEERHRIRDLGALADVIPVGEAVVSLLPGSPVKGDHVDAPLLHRWDQRVRDLLVHVNARSHLHRERDGEYRGHGAAQHLEWLFASHESASHATLVDEVDGTAAVDIHYIEKKDE